MKRSERSASKQARPRGVLLIGPFPEPVTGMSVANRMLAAELRKRGWNVACINTQARGAVQDLNSQGSMRLGVLASTIYSLTQTCFQLLRNRHSIVYVTPGQSFLGLLRYLPFSVVGKLLGRPIIAHFHGGNLRFAYPLMSALQKFMVRLTLRCYRRCIVLSPFFTTMFKDLVAAKRLATCSNGVEDDALASQDLIAAKFSAYQPDEAIKILFLSNIIRSKGVLDVIKACEILVRKKVKFVCSFAGSIDPDFSEEFIRRLKSSPASSHLNYHGIASGLAKRRLLASAHILCLPTYYPVEGQPIAILEGYANACAVVCTDHAGISDVFKDGDNGFFCEKKNPQSVVKAIERAFDAFLRIAPYNRKVAASKYRQSHFGERVHRQLVLADSN